MRREVQQVAMLRREGRPLPDYLIEPPAAPMQWFYLAAFWDLDTDRLSNGWTICPTPHSKILAYAQFKGLRGELLEAFAYVIRKMDAAYLDWERAEAEKNKPPKP